MKRTADIRVGILAFLVLFGLAFSSFAQESKSDSQTYTGEITKIDKKNKTLTIKGPKPGLVPAQPSPRGRGGSGGAPPPGGGRGSRGAAAGATPRGPDMRAYEDVESSIVWNDQTEVEAKDGKLTVQGLKVGDYVLIETTKDGKKIRAVKIKLTNALEG